MENIIELCAVEANEYRHLVATSNRRTGGWFTPTDLVVKILNQLPNEIWEEGKTFIDPECGIGQLIVPVAIIKRELGHKQILSTIFGTDIVEENISLCRQRLLQVCGETETNRQFVENNIFCKDRLNLERINFDNI
jgi:type I restriction-modification system DNA methylase subunit